MNSAQRKLVDLNFFSSLKWWRLICVCLMSRSQKKPQALPFDGIKVQFRWHHKKQRRWRPHPIDLNWWLERKKRLCAVFVCRKTVMMTCASVFFLLNQGQLYTIKFSAPWAHWHHQIDWIDTTNIQKDARNFQRNKEKKIATATVQLFSYKPVRSQSSLILWDIFTIFIIEWGAVL